jgi:glycine oxidase
VERTDIVVIGAGIIGNAIAWRLAQAGSRVVLLDKGEPGGEASSAAAGLLQPEAGREAGPQLLSLWLASLDQYPRFVDEVREVTRAAFDFRLTGRLVVALDDAEEARLRERARAQQAAGLAHRWLSGDEARRLEPILTPEARAAIYFEQHGLVDNARLTVALATAAARVGADVRPYEPALALALAGGRVAGVETPRGRIAADVVVNCAGAWAAAFAPGRGESAGLRRVYPYQRALDADRAVPLPVQPAKGEIIALGARPRPFERVITAPDGSISARSDGRIVVGATVRDVGFSKELTADGVARMLAAAVRIAPELRQARFLEAWTGLRPRTPDEQPILGPDPVPGLYWATGHYKMGILSAPATAEVVVALVEGRQPPVPVDQLGPGRFKAVTGARVS